MPYPKKLQTMLRLADFWLRNEINSTGSIVPTLILDTPKENEYTLLPMSSISQWVGNEIPQLVKDKFCFMGKELASPSRNVICIIEGWAVFPNSKTAEENRTKGLRPSQNPNRVEILQLSWEYADENGKIHFGTKIYQLLRPEDAPPKLGDVLKDHAHNEEPQGDFTHWLKETPRPMDAQLKVISDMFRFDWKI